MQAPSQTPRINLAHLKSQIEKNLGPEKACHYFSYLNRFLSQKLSKSGFNKLCLIILGPENIYLHNQLILSILKNACNAKAPPLPSHDKGLVKPPSREVGEAEDGLHLPHSTTSSASGLTNGDILPPSPLKFRAGNRERRLKDRPSPLGPNGKIDVGHQSQFPVESTARENGILAPCDLRRPLQHQADGAEHPTKRPRIDKSLQHDQVRVHIQGPDNVVGMENEEVVEHIKDSSSSWGPLRAPLGIPYCAASVGGARRPLPSTMNASSSSFPGSYCSGELCHTEILKKRMEEIAEAQGLESVTMDCANLLNKGLDIYLKGLIRSCVDLVGSRSGHEPTRPPAFKQQSHGKIINGMWPGNDMHVHSSESLEGSQDPRTRRLISLLDFKVAMELNPQQLGEDWMLLLEKICLCSFEE